MVAAVVFAVASMAASSGAFVPSIGAGPGVQAWYVADRAVVLGGPELAAGAQVRFGDDGAPHHVEVRGSVQVPLAGGAADLGVVFMPAPLFSLAILSVGAGTTVWQAESLELRLGGEVGVGPIQQFSGDVIDVVLAPSPGAHLVAGWPMGQYEMRLRLQLRATLTDRSVTPSATLLFEGGLPIPLP